MTGARIIDVRALTTGAARSALDLLYPERCAGCHAFGTSLCARCEATLVPVGLEGRCPFCAAKWDRPMHCNRCHGLHHIERIEAAFEMEGLARQMVHGLKYRRIRSLAEPMARHLQPLAAAHPGAAWFPVPLHRSRLRDRGFNQAESLLAALGLAPPPASGLRREHKTEKQVGRRARERHANVAGAFSYRGEPLEGRDAVLIDDVVTTGATVAECANVLRDFGARRVFVVCFARKSYDPERHGDPIHD